VIQCPACNVRAHKDHFLEYLKIHGTCPKCNKRLTMKAQAP
jgi:DNA-directed RNA polymerase subunit RPC12/RpoP